MTATLWTRKSSHWLTLSLMLSLMLSLLALAAPARAADDKKGIAYTPAEKQAMDEIEKLGGMTQQVAQNTDAHEVTFALQGSELTDAGLAQLKNVRNLVKLNLARTKITDAGLATVGAIATLQSLDLNNTKITDAGLAHLKNLKELTYLNLYGCEGVTDAGLEHVKALGKLKSLYLWQTKATADGVKKLGETNKELRANLGWDLTPVEAKVVEAKPAEANAALQAVNLKCPVSGKDVDPSKTFEHQGKLIGFCCDECLGKFKAKPDEFVGKVKEDNPAAKKDEKASAKPVNAKCPVSGKDIDASKTVTYKDKLVAFCCEQCLAKFQEKPEEFAAKIKEGS